MSTIRLTAAQAMVRLLAAARTTIDGESVPLLAGVWAIFGHGNVAAMGEALVGAQDELPTFRAHNEQAHGPRRHRLRQAVAAATLHGLHDLDRARRDEYGHGRRAGACEPPARAAHPRRRLCLAPAGPVLQQVEDFADATVSANDCFRPVSRLFDRITRPEQVVPAVDRALQVLTDPAACGPVTLAFCQDVQAEAADYPLRLFEPRDYTPRRPAPDRDELDRKRCAC